MHEMRELVELVAQEVFGGVLPPFPSVIIEAVLQIPCVRDAPGPETAVLVDALTAAISDYLDAQRAAEETEFAN